MTTPRLARVAAIAVAAVAAGCAGSRANRSGGTVPVFEEDDPCAGEPIQRRRPGYVDDGDAGAPQSVGGDSAGGDSADGEPTNGEPANGESLASVEGATGSNTISRADLDRVLDAGPGAFLAGVEVVATFHDRGFAGWRLERFWPHDSRFAGVDLRPGDVVVSVNDNSLERPDDLHRLWDSLRTAPTLVVLAERDGHTFALRYVIQSPP